MPSGSFPRSSANIAPVAGVIEPAGWTAEKLVHTGSDVTVLAAGSRRRPLQALIKVADTPAAAAGLKWQCEALTTLRGDARLGNLRDLLPRVLDAGEALGTAYVVESRVGGLGLEQLLRKRATREKAVSQAANAIGRLHSATARDTTVGKELLERWVGEPMRILREVTRTRRAPTRRTRHSNGWRSNFTRRSRASRSSSAGFTGTIAPATSSLPTTAA